MRSAFFLVLASAACRPAAPLRAVDLGGPRVVVAASADVGFTPRERAIIEAAADYLEREAGVRYVVTFDLEVTAAAMLRNQIWRPPVDAPVVTFLDAEYSGKVYGATQQVSPFRMWLLPQRTAKTWTFAHVVEHELLHAVGCDHVDDPRSVLYRFTTPDLYEALELSATDLRELDRALSSRP